MTTDQARGAQKCAGSVASRFPLAIPNSPRRTDGLMARRTLNRRELRAEAEAAEAMGLTNQTDPRRPARPKSEPTLRPKPAAAPRMRVVWTVCDVGGRPVATFDYPCKAEAEALAAQLKSKGKGTHFVRSVKEPI